jgi:hypothetical protein
MAWILVAAAAASLLVARLSTSPNGAVAAQQAAPLNTLDALLSSDASESRAARKTITEQRSKFIAAILTALRATNADQARRQCVVVLGDYRAIEAAPELAHHLDWDERWGTSLSRDNDDEIVPVMVALERIGAPALSPLLDVAAGSADTNIAAQCAYVCRRIDSQGLACRVDRLLQQTPTGETKDRLQQALTQSLPSMSDDTPMVAKFLAHFVQLDDEPLVAKCLEICKSIEGRDVTGFRLRQLLEKEANAQRKARIESALKILQSSRPAK